MGKEVYGQNPLLRVSCPGQGNMQRGAATQTTLMLPLYPREMYRTLVAARIRSVGLHPLQCR